MRPTRALAVAFGVVGLAVGVLLSYGCTLGAGLACPASRYQLPGILALVVGTALLLTGAFLPALVGSGGRASRTADSESYLMFCPTCGKRYRTLAGRFCPRDASELRPLDPVV